MKKTYRQGQILNLIRRQEIHTQEELAQALAKVGIEVTQVTLSRDIRELGLVKGQQGYREQEQAAAGPEETGTLRWAVQEFVRDVRVAQNIVIIKTDPGDSQPVGRALDREAWPEIVGTLAGDDTVFVATSDARQALKAKEKLLALLR
ncbi:MAG: ArgR family transcriptional regulator [Acidobacteria bacterium RIFCSPLOWO2_02_FULL_59_13]|nr:MAG: ArgR family transcriptional regulator [Acidobacteria bacterium RIFCSPLOWO2_02_FULL_59_13]